MKYRITKTRRLGLEIYLVTATDGFGDVAYRTTRWSPEGARLAIMQYKLKRGAIV